MIDAHQHLWKIGSHGCVWPTPDLDAIYRDFDLTEAKHLARKKGVTGTVLVQSQESDADTDYLLAMASRSQFIKAVVGWVDLGNARAPQRIRKLAVNPKFRSVRPMLQSMADDGWIMKPQQQPAIKCLIEENLCFDALVFARHLPYLDALTDQYPELPVVIDHAAKPPLSPGSVEDYRQWQYFMQKLAAKPQVYCKLSGLVTEMAASQCEPVLQQCVERLLYWFGSGRLMWGSDWPVVNLAANPQLAGYENWSETAMRLLADCSPAEKYAITEGNVLRFYGISRLK